MKKAKKTIIIIAIVLASISILQSVLILTGVFNRFVRENLERVLSESLKGSCHITDIKGNWNYFTISGVEIRSKNLDSDIYRGEIEINLAAILLKKIIINRLYLDSANVYIKDSAHDSFALKDTLPEKSIEETMNDIPFSIDASEVTLQKINVYYDTLFVKNIDLKVVLSFNKKRGYLLYRFENCDVNGILNMKGTNGELGIKSDSVFHKGVITTEIFSIDNSLVYRNKELFIRKAEFKAYAKKYNLFKHTLNLDGDAEITGSISSRARSINLEARFDRFEIDSLRFDGIKIDACLFGDTVRIDRIECTDSTFPLRADGFVEISPSLNAEFDISLNGIKAEHFIRKTEIKENGLYGVVHLKSNLKNAASIVIDSLNGYYGNIKNLLLTGAASYVNEEFLVKNVILKIEGGELSADGSFGNRRGELNVKAVNFPLELLTSIKNDISVSGQAGGEMKIAGGFEDFTISYNVEMTNAYFGSNTFEYFSSNGSLQCTDKGIKKGLVQGSFINGEILGKNVSIVYFEGMKESSRVYMDIDGVSEILSFGMSTILNFSDDMSGADGEILRLDIKTDVDEFSLKNPTEIHFAKSNFQINSFFLSGAKGYLKGDFSVSKDSLKFNVDGYDDNLTITKFVTGVDVKGDITFNAKSEGRKDSLLMNLSASLKHFNFEGITVDSVLLNCDYDGDNFDINYLNVLQEEKTSYFYGRINVDEKEIKNSTMDISFNLENVDEKYFMPLENVFTIKTKSGLRSIGKISGNITHPKLSGDIFLDSTDIYIVSLGTTVKGATGQALLKGDSAIVTQLRGKTEKGDVLLTGGVSLNGYAMEEYWFYILAEGAHSTGIDYVDVFANCSLDIRGDMEKVDMDGKIKITEGVSNLPFTQSAEASQSGEMTKYQSNMNLRIYNDNNLWLKNSFVDAELKGDVLLKKQGMKWNITGKANVIRGYYFYLDKKFKVDSGIFELKETNKIVEPVINISSSTKILYIDGEEKKQADVFLTATGSAFKPTITLYSEPAMGIENIISILSFNTTVASLSNFEEISRGVPEKALQIYLRNKYLNTISSSIGVDQLDIQTNLLGSEKSAKLSVGKYIGKRIFVSYTHDVFTFQKDIFRIEYNIIKNTDLVTERDEQGNFNTGLQFKYRF